LLFRVLWYHGAIQYRINNKITAKELRVVDENTESLGVFPLEKALAMAKEKGLDLIEIAPKANPPVARIISFDKFRYQKDKEERKQRQAQKSKDLKSVRITPRAAENDLQMKVSQVEKFLEGGHKVEINIFLRGRERRNKDWALKKMKDFLSKISVPHIVSMPPKPGGRGFVAQVSKK